MNSLVKSILKIFRYVQCKFYHSRYLRYVYLPIYRFTHITTAIYSWWCVLRLISNVIRNIIWLRHPISNGTCQTSCIIMQINSDMYVTCWKLNANRKLTCFIVCCLKSCSVFWNRWVTLRPVEFLLTTI